ncbi:MAG: hypothetical protein AAB460_01815 [Patescibacteria group bacterium]
MLDLNGLRKFLENKDLVQMEKPLRDCEAVFLKGTTQSAAVPFMPIKYRQNGYSHIFPIKEAIKRKTLDTLPLQIYTPFTNYERIYKEST